MEHEPRSSFMIYWDAIDNALKSFFGLDGAEAGIGAGSISAAYDSGEHPNVSLSASDANAMLTGRAFMIEPSAANSGRRYREPT